MKPSKTQIIQTSEIFAPPLATCISGDSSIWDSYLLRDTGDLTVDLYENITVLGGYDVTKVESHHNHPAFNGFFAAPADIRNNPLIRGIKPQVEKIKEAVTIFNCANCYGHFLLEFLPMFKALEWLRGSDESFRDMPVLVPQLSLDWQTAPVMTVEVDDYCHQCVFGKMYQIEKAWNISRPCNSIIPKWIVAYLKKNFILKPATGAKRKVFVSRSKVQAARRQINNYQQVVDILKAYGFEELHPQEKSVFEQAQIFSESNTVFGIHGSGNLNFVFCQPGQRLIEMIPSRWPCHYGFVCAGANQAKYYYTQIEGGQDSNFTIDDGLLRNMLDKAL